MNEKHSDLDLIFRFYIQLSDSDFRFRFRISDFRFRFQIQISDSDFRFKFHIQVSDSDFRFRFQISDFWFGFQIQIYCWCYCWCCFIAVVVHPGYYVVLVTVKSLPRVIWCHIYASDRNEQVQKWYSTATDDICVTTFRNWAY